MVRRNVDELCELPDEVTFAAAHNTGTEARTCFNKKGDYLMSEQCNFCRHHGIRPAEVRGTYWTARSLKENRSHLPNCTYEFNTGVMVTTPFSRHDFRAKVFDPILCGRVPSADKTDQGAINHLVHYRKVFSGVRLLNSTYNAITRVRFLRYGLWNSWHGALYHHTNSPKPWRERRVWVKNNRTVREGFDDLTKQYRAMCPMSLTLNLTGLPAAGVG